MKINEKDNILYREGIYRKINKGERVDIKEFKIYLRNHPTYSEYLLKHAFLSLRKERFTFQHIIGPYIVDFYHAPLRLVIEIDGISHDEKTIYDKKRYEYLLNTGHKIIVLNDMEVKDRKTDVTQCIADVIKFLNVLKKHNNLDNKKGMIFKYSPLAFGSEEMLEGFSEEERKPETDVFGNM